MSRRRHETRRRNRDPFAAMTDMTMDTTKAMVGLTVGVTMIEAVRKVK